MKNRQIRENTYSELLYICGLDTSRIVLGTSSGNISQAQNFMIGNATQFISVHGVTYSGNQFVVIVIKSRNLWKFGTHEN